jgi:hypothetical protein
MKGSSTVRGKGTATNKCSPMKGSRSGSCHVERQLRTRHLHYLTAADPPMTVTGRLPRPLSKSVPIKANWYDICDMDTPELVKLHKQALATPFKECTTSMRVIIHRMITQARSSNMSLITTLQTTPVDTLTLLKGWQLNPHGVPPAVRQELDGTMNLHDVDVWMWLQKATPNKNSSGLRKSLWALFQQPGRWFDLTSD